MNSEAFADRARQEKARVLARYIYRTMLETTAELTAEDWWKIAEKADVKPPSEQTQKLVLELLKGKEPRG